jgi:hypothetical protein
VFGKMIGLNTVVNAKKKEVKMFVMKKIKKWYEKVKKFCFVVSFLFE